MAVADGAQIPILNDILKSSKQMNKSLLNGFSLLNKNLLNQTKAMTLGQKGIMTAVISMRKHAEGNAKTMVEGFGNLLDAERKALEFEKQEAIKEGLKEGENTREGGGKGLLNVLPKGKDLIDPKKWGDFAKGFVGALFGMLSSLVTTILVPLAVGAMKGYYGTIAKFFGVILKGIKGLFGMIGGRLLVIGATLGKLGLEGLTKAGDKIRDAVKVLGANASAKILGFIDTLKDFFARKIWDLKFSFATSKLMDFITRVKGFFASKIFDMEFKFAAWLDDFAQSPIGRFIEKVKGFFKFAIFGTAGVDDALGKLPKTFEDSMIGKFVAKVRSFFNLPIFTEFGTKISMGFKNFGDTSIGKFFGKIKDFFGSEAKAFGGGLLDDIKSMGKGIYESSLGKFFGKIKTFFGFGDEPGPFQKLIKFFKTLFDFKLPDGITKTMGMIGKVFGKVFAIFGIFMGIYEAVKAFTTTEGTFGEKVVAALKAFIDEVVFGLPNFLVEMVGKGVSGLLKFLGFGDSAKAVEDATKDFSIMDLITDSVGKVWKWMKGFFSDLFSFEDLSIDSLLPSFDFDFGNPLKIIGEKLSAVLAGGADIVGEIPLAGKSLKKFFMGLSDKVGKWGMDEGKPASGGNELQSRSGGVIPGRLTGEQVPAILHANEIVLAEQSAKLFMQAAQMFAQPEYLNSIKDLVKNNDDIKTQTTDAIMQAGAMQGGDGGTTAMIAQLAAQTEALGATMAQIPGAVQQGASTGARTGTSFTGFSKLSNPHEKKAK